MLRANLYLWFVLLYALSNVFILNVQAQQDIGAQVNAEFTACSNACTVQIPAGMYTQTTTINFPCATDGRAALVGTGPGTILNYVGSGDAISALCPGTASENLVIKDLRILLTSTAFSGIHLRSFNGGTISNVLIEGGTTGDGLLNEGANGITITASTFQGNRNGMRNISIANYDPNAVHVFGGQIQGNSHCGVYEEGSQYGPSLGNSYDGITFQTNGSNGDSTSGNMCLQSPRNLSVRDSYFEYSCNQSVPFSIWVGDSQYQTALVLFEGNTFLSCGSTATINLANSFATSLVHNSEGGAISSFVQQGAPSWDTTILADYALAVQTFATGNTTNINYVTTHN